MTLRRGLLLLLPLLLPSLPRGLAAQSCPGGRIAYVFVDNHSIFDLDALPGTRFQWVYSLANRLHVRTRPTVVGRELLFRTGDCYDAYLVEDSERRLRRLPFISNAEVYGIRQPDGDWHVVVDTHDEWSTRIEVTADFENGPDVRRLAIAERNFLGRGASVTAFLSENDANREIGGELATPQLLGTETDFLVAGGETRVGGFHRFAVTYPFLGEVGRFAWGVRASAVKDYFDYSAGTPASPSHLLLPFEERSFELSGAVRFGEPGGWSVLGVGVSREVLDLSSDPDGLRRVRGNDFGELLPPLPGDAEAVSGQTVFPSGTRVSLFAGRRNISFVQRTGLDALRGITDLEVGTDVSLTLSRTVRAAGPSGTPDDLNARLALYAAVAPPSLTLTSSFVLEGRRVFRDPEIAREGWRNAIAEADVLAYWQPPRLARHTFLYRLSAAGAWSFDHPYQVTLGGRRGVRGYRPEDFPGARRVVMNAEDRIFLGSPLEELFDLGLTLFGDLGRTWRGDVPFGLDSGWRGTVGAGLRIGFPSGSRDVARIDLAWPADGRGIGRSPIFRISLVDLIGLGGGLADPQLDRSRLLRVRPDRFTPHR